MTYTLKLEIDPVTSETVLTDTTDYGPLGLLACSFEIFNSADEVVASSDPYEPSVEYRFPVAPDGVYRIEYETNTTLLGVIAETHYGFISFETTNLMNDRLIKWADPDITCCKEFPVSLKVLFDSIQIALADEQYDRCELILYRVKQALEKTCPGC